MDINRRIEGKKLYKVQGTHNILLHRNKNIDKCQNIDKNDNKANLNQRDNEIKINKIENITNILATALVNIKTSSGEFLTCRAVLDSGSQINLISRKMADKLGLNGQAENIAKEGSNIELKSSCLSIEISDFKNPNSVNLLLDISIFDAVLRSGKINLGKNCPSLRNTLFGWVVLEKSIDSPSKVKFIEMQCIS